MQAVLVPTPQESVVLPGKLRKAEVSLKEVQWEREVALIIDMGEQSTGGYHVAVAGINLGGGDEIHLTLQVTRPQKGGFVAQAFTHPFAITRIPRVGLRSGEIMVTARDQHGTVVIQQAVNL